MTGQLKEAILKKKDLSTLLKEMFDNEIELSIIQNGVGQWSLATQRLQQTPSPDTIVDKLELKIVLRKR